MSNNPIQEIFFEQARVLNLLSMFKTSDICVIYGTGPSAIDPVDEEHYDTISINDALAFISNPTISLYEFNARYNDFEFLFEIYKSKAKTSPILFNQRFPLLSKEDVWNLTKLGFIPFIPFDTNWANAEGNLINLFENIFMKYCDKFSFAPVCHCGGSVSDALSLAVAMRYEKIVFRGVDLNSIYVTRSADNKNLNISEKTFVELDKKLNPKVYAYEFHEHINNASKQSGVHLTNMREVTKSYGHLPVTEFANAYLKKFAQEIHLEWDALNRDLAI